MNYFNVFSDIVYGGNVKRFHTFRMNQDQDVAQHSFNAALIAAFIAEKVNVDNSRDGDDKFCNPHKVMTHMLFHDIAEQWTGDVPSIIKTRYPEIGDTFNKIESDLATGRLGFSSFYRDSQHLNVDEKCIVKFVDQLEAFITCKNEQMMGNIKLGLIADKIMERLVEISHNSTIETKSVFEGIIEQYGKY